MSDAHAWTEVFIPQSGWIAFDPTGSLPAGSSGIERRSALDYFVSYVQFVLQRAFNQSFVKAFLNRTGAFLGPVVSRSLTWLYAVWTPLLIAAGVGAVLALIGQFGWRFARLQFRIRGDNAGSDERSEGCLRLLKGVANEMAAVGFPRQRWETLIEWSRRVEGDIAQPTAEQRFETAGVAVALSNFCDLYCRVRYGREEEDFAQLAQCASNVRSAIKRSRATRP